MTVTIDEDERQNVAHLQIDYGPVNALTPDHMDELIEEVSKVPEDVSVLTITATDQVGDDGSVSGFSAGIDLDSMTGLSTTEAYEMLEKPYQLLQMVRDLDAVTVCGLGSFALGLGFEIGLCCDYRVATEDAKFGLPEINAGIPTFLQGGLLLRYVGLQTAKDMCYTGRMLSGTESADQELVNHAVSEEAYKNTLEDVVETLAAQSPSALRAQKRVFQMWRSNGLENGMRDSRKLGSLLFDTHDQREGFAAILEERQPEFKGI